MVVPGFDDDLLYDLEFPYEFYHSLTPQRSVL
jgi:hypothetical protein